MRYEHHCRRNRRDRKAASAVERKMTVTHAPYVKIAKGKEETTHYRHSHGSTHLHSQILTVCFDLYRANKFLKTYFRFNGRGNYLFPAEQSGNKYRNGKYYLLW